MISPPYLYSLAGLTIFVIGLAGVIACPHLLRKVLAANVMGTGVFLFLVAMADRHPSGIPDPVPHAMVLTGIVVAVSSTGFALVMIVHYFNITGRTEMERPGAKRKDHRR